jgi:uncharacterized protein (TIGR03083 family)
MEANAQLWIGALRRSHDQLQALVEPLDAAQLRSRAYPSQWSIAQVLSHLGSGSQVFDRFIDSGLTGAPPPGIDVMQPIWDEWNAKTPDAQAADGLDSDDALVKRLESLTPDELERFHLSMFGMELDVAGLCRLRLSEHTLHTWDVAVALDPAATLNPDATALLIDGVAMMGNRGVNPGGEPLRLQINTTSPARSFALEAGEAVSFSEGPMSAPDAEVVIPSEALIRLLAGRLDPDHTPPIVVHGIELDRLRQMYPGY